MKKAAERIMQEALDLLLTKNADYSPDNIRAVGVPGIASRLVDKVMRLRTLADGREANHESLDDTLRDILNYAVMAQLVKRGEWPRGVRSVYVAGPIDDDPRTQHHDESIATQLAVHDIAGYFPRGAYCCAQDAPQFVQRVNRAAIDACDAVLVYWPDAVPSVGTAREVEYARAKGKPVHVIAPWSKSLEWNDCIRHDSLNAALAALAPSSS